MLGKNPAEIINWQEKITVSIDTKMLTMATGSVIIEMNQLWEEKRIEEELDVRTYLDRLKYAIKSNLTQINFIKDRQVDEKRDKKFTNRYTMAQLFPDEDEVAVLKRELAFLTVEDYAATVKDLRYPKRSEMRVFGKQYFGEDVYIKIRVELVNITYSSGGSYILVMSFHFSDGGFKDSDFPYRKSRGFE